MKIMVISDTHNEVNRLQELLELFQRQSFDKLYLLGDLGRLSIDLLNPFHERILAVTGNCDTLYEKDHARFDLPLINYDYAFGRTIVLTHGHYYNRYNYHQFQASGYGIFLSGHTHESVIYRNRDGSIDANPGSLGQPRDGHSSYMVIDEIGMKIIDSSTKEVIHFQDF